MGKNLFDKLLFFLPFEAGILNERFNFVVILRFCTTEYRIIKSDLYHERVQYLEIYIYTIGKFYKNRLGKILNYFTRLTSYIL